MTTGRFQARYVSIAARARKGLGVRLARGAAPRALVAYTVRVAPIGSLVVGALITLSAALPFMFTLASGELIGHVRQSLAHPAPVSHVTVLRLVVVMAVLFVMRQLAAPALQRATSEVGWTVESCLQRDVMRATSSPPTLDHLEDPATLDLIALASAVDHDWLTPMTALEAVSRVMVRYLTCAASLTLICYWSVWIGLVVFMSLWIWAARWRDDFRALMRVMIGETETFRMADYVRNLALEPAAAKEVRTYDLDEWLRNRYQRLTREAFHDVWRMRGQFWRPFAVGMVLVFAIRAAAYVFLVDSAIAGQIGIGQFVVVLQAMIMLGQLASQGDDDIKIAQGSSGVPAALELAALMRTSAVEAKPRMQPVDVPREVIRFENVSFSYRSSEHRVLANLDLEIPAGRSLAIVGVNGAGKTTLVKLLARLHNPESGRITVDGIDLQDLDARGWQRHVAAVFQDFVRYPLSAMENIGFGAKELLHDREAISLAARKAGALPIVDSLPRGWDTTLSKGYRDGAELSGGEWQRIALARALLAVAGGATVLVLDEPTAHLDVRSEAKIYDDFLQITRGLTTIVISHRFSTVRRADQIVVLERGRVVEIGTHDELVVASGRYAEMYAAQASAFRIDGAI